jgi:hypothetical protein
VHHLKRFLQRLLNVLRPHRADADLAREIAADLALLEDEYRRRGLAPDEARRQARVAFGGLVGTAPGIPTRIDSWRSDG